MEPIRSVEGERRVVPEPTLRTLQANARMVRDRLHSMLARRAEGRVRVQPSEFEMLFDRAKEPGLALFHGMACTVVERKYARAGYAKVAGAIARRRVGAGTAIEALGHRGSFVGRSDEERRIETETTGWLRTIQRRCGSHQTRYSYGGDVDLHICARVDYRYFGMTAVAWPFQQEDLLYRWSPAAEQKLRYLADCWDAYSRCDFVLADVAIGMSDFPLSERLWTKP